MARNSDHDKRDAEHVLRCYVAMELSPYGRRMLDRGKAYITDAIADAEKEGKGIDGKQIGRTAAAKVIAEYFAPGAPQPAIETTATPEPLQLEGSPADRAADARISAGFMPGPRE